MTARTVVLAAALLSLASPGGAGPDEPAAPGPAPAQADRDARARVYFTDTVLVDQDGRPRRFYEDVLRGNTVVISFLFARCVDACPLIAQKLNAVARQLGEAYPRDVRFVTISVDPENDGPAEMKRFLEKHRAPLPGWTFLGGGKDEVHAVLKRLGQFVDDPTAHFTGFIAANVARGHWMKVRPDVTAQVLAETMRNLASETGAPVAAGPR